MLIDCHGYTDASIYKAGGNPYGTTITQGQDGKMVEDVKAAIFYQAKRTVEVAKWLKKGKEYILRNRMF